MFFNTSQLPFNTFPSRFSASRSPLAFTHRLVMLPHRILIRFSPHYYLLTFLCRLLTPRCRALASLRHFLTPTHCFSTPPYCLPYASLSPLNASVMAFDAFLSPFKASKLHLKSYCHLLTHPRRPLMHLCRFLTSLRCN